MTVTLNTSIEQLRDAGLISVRASNVLINNSIDTVRSFLKTNLSSFSNHRNCGRKTMEELEAFQQSYKHLYSGHETYYPSAYQVLTDAVKSYLNGYPIEIINDIHNVYGGDLELLTMSFPNPRMIFESIRLEDYDKSQIVRNTIKELIEHASQDLSVVLSGPQEINEIRDFVKSWDRYYSELDILNRLDPIMRENIEYDLYQRFKNLSIRTQNCFRNHLSLEFMLETVYTPNKLNITAYKNCGAKTLKQFEKFLEESAEIYSNTIKKLYDATDWENYRLNINIARISRLYPFLSHEHLEEAASLSLDGENDPAIYLLFRYIEGGLSQSTLIYREYYDLSDRGKKMTLGQIAEQIGVTQERVRQIKSQRLSLPDTLEEALRSVRNKFTQAVIGKNHPVWAELKRDNNLSLKPRQLMGLITAFIDSYTIVELNEDFIYLVLKDLLKNVKIRTTLGQLEAIINKRRTESFDIDVLQLIRGSNSTSDYHERFGELSPVFMEYFAIKDGVEIVGDHILRVSGNRVNKVYAVEKVLEDAGRALTFNELWNLYQESYPEYPIKNRDSFRSYIIRSPRIVAKGKSGIYVMKHWAGHFQGSLTDYIYHLIENSPSPLKMEELAKRAKEQFPKSSRSSIYTLVYMDPLKRYTLLEGGLVGLTVRDYGEIKPKKRRLASDSHPSIRLKRLEDFIATYRRLPTSSAKVDGEETLYRWIYNVTHDKISVSDNIKSRLAILLDPTSDLPHTMDESNFRDMAEKVRFIISNYNRLPDREKETDEYKWFNKTIHSQDTFGDRRDRYIAELKQQIESAGINI